MLDGEPDRILTTVKTKVLDFINTDIGVIIDYKFEALPSFSFTFLWHVLINAIEAWNNWTNYQKSLTNKADKTTESINNHIDLYNDELLRTSPNYEMCKDKFKDDKNDLKTWDSYLDDLSASTYNFASQSKGLSSDKQKYADDALANMRSYQSEIRNEQMYYSEVCNYIVVYIDTIKNGTPDNSLLNKANEYRTKGNTAIQNANNYSNRAADAIARL